MGNIKIEDSIYLIPINKFEICKIDGVSRKSIIALYPTRKNGAYYLNKFSNYIKNNYQISLKDYCKKYLEIDWPKCPKKGSENGYKISGKGLVISRYSKGGINKDNCSAFSKGCDRLSKERTGAGNPMFGKVPWNRGLDNSHPIIKRNADLRKGTKTSEETKKKQSNSAKIRKIHGHTGKKHSPETIEKLRTITADRIKNKKFHRESSLNIKVREFLDSLNLTFSYEKEFTIKYFSCDFAFPQQKIAIECQGTFFHIDPRIYPNGPICAVQRRNFGRDKVKREYLEKHGWKLIEIWETEINDDTFKKYLECKLKELNILKE